MEIVSEDAVESTEVVDGVHLKLLASGEEENVQYFTIEAGAVVPEHSHPHEQVGYLLDGRLTFENGSERWRVTAGDSYVIPGGDPHSAENPGDGPAVGVDIFSPPRNAPDWRD